MSKPGAKVSIDHNGRRSQARTLDKKLMIESAAAGLFADHGYEGVSMRDIAQTTDVQLGTLTYLYPNKQTIYDAVVSASVRYFGTKLVEAAQSTDDAHERLSRFIAALVHMHARRTTHGQVIARELVEGGRSRMAVLGHPTFQALRALLNPAIAELSGRDLSPEDADLMTGHIIQMSYAAIRSQDFYSGTFGQSPLDEDRYITLLTRFMLGGLRAVV